MQFTVAHCGPKRSGLSCRALLLLPDSILRFSLVKKKFQQRHPYRHAVGRLFEVVIPAIFIDLRESSSTGQRMHDDRILNRCSRRNPAPMVG